MNIDSLIKEKMIHIWYHCHNCHAAPIIGTRYQCETCPTGPDNDLCEKCYNLLQRGEIQHPAVESFNINSENKKHHFSSHQGKSHQLYKNWLQVPHSQAPAPKVPNPFVLRPIFCAGTDSSIAGYSFAVNIDEYPSPLLLTALHVMDEIIKKIGIDCTEKNKNYTGKELPSIISEVNLFDVFSDNWMMNPMGSAGPMLVLPEARINDEEPYSYRDIAAFWLKDASNINPATLAKNPPIVSDPVWLLAKPNHPIGENSFKATVVEVTDRSLIFKFDDPREKPKYSSGAPLINQKGEIVGINVGGGIFENQKFGHANHVGNIRHHLKPALIN